MHDRGDMWILYGVTLLYGLGGDLFAASRGAMLKAMVDDELLAEANGAYQSIREGLRIVAPLAGAGIFAAWGGSVVAMVDAGTFLVSAAALAALRFAEPRARRRSTTSSRRSPPASRTSRAPACCAS